MRNLEVQKKTTYANRLDGRIIQLTDTAIKIMTESNDIQNWDKVVSKDKIQNLLEQNFKDEGLDFEPEKAIEAQKKYYVKKPKKIKETKVKKAKVEIKDIENNEVN